jgi:hypothetical protein
MAFNPFNWFRKHQKVFFAGLTILCMLVFIGQFGAGDVVQRALGWVGAGRGGATVAKVYGDKVNERELELLGRKRQVANTFVEQAVLTNLRAVLKELEEQAKAEIREATPLAALNVLVAGYKARVQSPPPQDEERLAERLAEIRRDFGALRGMVTNPQVKDDPERLRTLERMAGLLGVEAWSTRIQMAGRPEWYFGGSRRPDDLLDFLAWKHQADKLGIVLTDEDVRKEVNREAGRDVIEARKFEEDKFVERFLSGNRQDLSVRELLDGVRDEFRVALAQGVLVGLEPGARAYRSWLGAGRTPAFATPDEFLRYFRDQRTTLRVKLLDLPVSAFVDKVDKVYGEPTEEELLRRYQDYKDQEPDPAKRQPGFKRPRRIRVEYASVSPAEQWYKDRGRQAVEPLLVYSDPGPGAALRFAAGASAACQVGVGGLPAALCLGLPAAFDPLGHEYLKFLEDNPHAPFPPEVESLLEADKADKLKKLQPASVLRPDNAAATFGQLLGAGAGRGSAFAAPTAFYASATAAEIRDSVRFNTAWLMAHATAGQQFPAVGVLFTRFGLTAPFLPVVSPEKVRPQLVAELERRYAEQTLENNLKTFTDELAKRKGKPEEARAYVRKAAEEYRFRLEPMPRPLGRNEIVDLLNRKDDTPLRALYEAFQKNRDALRRQFNMPLPPFGPAEFTEQLFRDSAVYQASRIGLPDDGKAYLFWHSQELPGGVEPFEKVRTRVAEAWRFEKARVLARREARRLAEEVNKHPLAPADAERFLREQRPGDEPFELDRVAQLVSPEKEVHEGVRTEYRPYRLPEDRTDVFPYPPRPAVKLVRDLLRGLKQAGQATVVADRPERHFYVAVLFDRAAPTLKEFYRVYKRAGQGDDDLWDRFVEQHREDYRRQVIEQLRRDASGGKVDEQGRWDIPKEIRDRYEGREGGE